VRAKVCEGSLDRSWYVVCMLVFSSFHFFLRRFYDAMKSQARSLLMEQNGVRWTGHCLVFCGTVLVAASYWALGFYATFLGMSFLCWFSAVSNFFSTFLCKWMATI